jgi:D-alanyl-D-alanine carboxypeptidase
MAPAAWANRYSALLIDADSGRVLLDRQAREPRYPASLTKMMTLYMVFDALKRGQLRLNEPLRVSREAASRPPSKLRLKAGETITVEQAIYGLVTRSANDAATVIAEALAGSEARFGQQMTSRARTLGMRQTYFRNASGLPDPGQVTTAWDMATLARALMRDHPRFYRYFSTGQFYFRGRVYRNHNHLLESYAGADGIKTGYIRTSGYNLVASARRNGRRIIGVVFGGNTAKQRDTHMHSLLDYGFAQLNGSGGGFRVAGSTYHQAPASVESNFQDSQPPLVSSARSVVTAHSVWRPGSSRPEGTRQTTPTTVISSRRPVAVDYSARQPVSTRTAQARQAAPAPTISSRRPIPADSAPSPSTPTRTERVRQEEPSPTVELIGRSEESRDLSADSPVTSLASNTSGFWQVQVGVFGQLASARQHLSSVAQTAPDVLFNAKATIIPLLRGGTILYRALFQGLSQQQASNICDALKRRRIDCLTAPQTS